MLNNDPTNPEIEQSRVGEAAELFDKYGYTMFPQQRAIYENIVQELAFRPESTGSVLEAGCGNGMGTAMLENMLPEIVTGTDKLADNIRFAGGLYPWIPFYTWDLNNAGSLQAEIVIAIEVFEHVADPYAAMQNLLNAASKELWVSTPNGFGKQRPPSNPYHVQEYTPAEMFEFATSCEVLPEEFVCRHWKTFEVLDHSQAETVDPLVYQIRKI